MKCIFVLCMALLLTTECIAQARSITIPKEDIAYSNALLEQINLYRMKKGLNQLRLDPALIKLAKQHSVMMYQKQQTSHNNFQERFQQAESHLCVENVGWNYSLPQEMFEGWRMSGGHNRNMLKEGLNRAGIAKISKYVTFFACK